MTRDPESSTPSAHPRHSVPQPQASAHREQAPPQCERERRRAERDHEAACGTGPEQAVAQDLAHRAGEAGDGYRGQRQGDKYRDCENQHCIGDATGSPSRVGARMSASGGDLARHRHHQALAESDEQRAARELEQREEDRPGRIEIEAQRLVDRDLHRARRRPAPQGEHHCEAREAEHEHESRDPRQGLAEQRPFDEAPDCAGSHAELRDEAPSLAGTADQSGRRRRTASGRLKNTCARRIPPRPVQVRPARHAQEARQVIDPSRVPVDRHDPEHRDDAGHDQRQADELQQPRPSRQPFAPRERSRHRYRETGAERGGEQRLPRT